MSASPETQVLAAVSNAVVRLYKEHFGRGPTRARSEWAGPDQIVVTLEDSLTPAERRLLDLGEFQRLRDQRQYLQHAAAGVYCAAVEAVTGRRVRAFVSGMDPRADVACDIFVLEPEDGA